MDTSNYMYVYTYRLQYILHNIQYLHPFIQSKHPSGSSHNHKQRIVLSAQISILNTTLGFFFYHSVPTYTVHTYTVQVGMQACQIIYERHHTTNIYLQDEDTLFLYLFSRMNQVIYYTSLFIFSKSLSIVLSEIPNCVFVFRHTPH